MGWWGWEQSRSETWFVGQVERLERERRGHYPHQDGHVEEIL